MSRLPSPLLAKARKECHKTNKDAGGERSKPAAVPPGKGGGGRGTQPNNLRMSRKESHNLGDKIISKSCLYTLTNNPKKFLIRRLLLSLTKH